MSDFREEEALGKAYDSQLLRRLMTYLRPYKWSVVFAVVLTLLVGPLEVVGPYLFGFAVDKYIIPGLDVSIPWAAALRGVTFISLVSLAALLLSFAVQYLQVRIMQNVGQQTLYDLRKEVFERLQRLPMSFFDRTPVGRLVTRVTTDIDALNDLFAAGIAAMANDAIVLLCIGAVMMWMNWRLALATFAVLPLILFSTWIFRDRVRDANRRIRTAIARINAFLQEHISGMGIVQLFNRERKSTAEFAELNRIHMEAYKDAILAFAVFFPAVELFSTTAIAIVFWYGGLRSLSGLVDVGVLITFMQYAQRFFRPIQDLSEKFNILQSAMAACERIFKLLDEPLPAPPKEAPLPIINPRGEIEFRNVWFAYTGGANPSDEDWVLRDVSFRIAPGQTLAIVGHTGAGKTTLISLLLRFYDIQRGEILLDGVDVRRYDVHDLRRQFGIVLQDPFLFSGTLETNVRLGNEEIGPERVEAALLEGRTAMVIAHRLSTIQHADRILVFHKGRLREQGSHQELLAMHGIYYRLYQLQYKDQELRTSLEP